ncbi:MULTISPECIES: nuclear transport factor 2 family protein [Photobacterium]|uniref:Transcriptional regulator n=1 Tax=Photobacterium ganghwense TaxID=320778 RepID=A0A0J1HJ45_9GAMM|nr:MULTISPECIES: nuclear transport factor 2 family protein [Photobacterium]KLV11620.1 transcriptional regulator [Photobacterium ganghwense]MBV1841000.1 nuclear transport factor 2 family protein [Photobacterium ganghwense]PSU08492.1 nuclear transport factor 2 family protein [Photobacterium ganghwense]QSV15300.1 nuclear transport factor 2 family protein [Photobacterium ganghwense]
MSTQTKEMLNDQVSVEFLQAFSAAWNNHDIDALMSFVTDDCVFHTAAGPEVFGSTFSGRDAVRESFQQVWKNFPDAAWLDGDHFVSGDRAISESTFCATKPDGSRIEARMVDVFTLKDGKIQVKNAFRKDRPSQLSE